MESFSLLKYLRRAAGGGGGGATTVTAVAADTNGEDEGPFFDLDFAVPEDGEGHVDGEDVDGHVDGEDGDGHVDGEDGDGHGDGEEEEFNFALSSDEISAGGSDVADELFFKGDLVPLDPASIVIASSEEDTKPQFLVSFLKSATKYGVFMLGLRKSKPVVVPGSPKQQDSGSFLIKFKVGDVPIISLFARDNSSRVSETKATGEEEEEEEERRHVKEAIQKYLGKIKPLYVRVSKAYIEKLRFSKAVANEAAAEDESGAAAAEDDDEIKAAPPNTAVVTCGVKGPKASVPAVLKVVCKRLGKSRPATATVAAVTSPAAQRRDDSLLQQEDGIQSAIAHCKRSFNAS
ncbi:probable membrane-associated kinase regulator 2 [Typha latifolia]|uniref:probable membrane-associated kinase regulator 2 n=1 Tax=Typha latifolia TaxID=4733 RepID=UPI003C2D81D9